MNITELPQTMRASVLSAPHDVSVQSIAVPTPDADQVLVRVEAVGLCGSDQHYYEDGRIGDFVVREPIILGHEAAGVIVAVGDAIDPGRIGQRVSIEPQRACRVCHECKLGRYNLCPEMEFYATPPIDGAFAEYVAIQSDYAHVVPDSMSLEAAALCEPLSVGIWACQKAGITAGSRVLIAGGGAIGLLTAQVAKAFGAMDVIVSDPIPSRRRRALDLGATEVIDPMQADATSIAPVDAFIDASGSGAAITSGIGAVRPAGTVVLVGMGAASAMLPVATIQNRELVVTGVFRYANTWPLAIQLASSGRVDLDSLVTSRHGLAEVEEAMRASTAPDALKTIVIPTQVAA